MPAARPSPMPRMQPMAKPGSARARLAHASRYSSCVPSAAMKCLAMSSGESTKSGSPRSDSSCHATSRMTSTPSCARRCISGRRRVAMAARHEEIGGQLGPEVALARLVERALAHGGELVPHAAVVVVIGDLRGGAASAYAAGTKLAKLMDVVPAHEPLSNRVHQLGLVVDLELLLQVDHDQVG